MDEQVYGFLNMSTEDVRSDLMSAFALMKGINPRLRFIVTVSPVPLVATYEKRHVLVSTMYSKSALRAAAEDVTNLHGFIDYFPSYELIVGHFNGGRYFESDLRSVRTEGVEHVMRIFSQHYLGETDAVPESIEETIPESVSNGLLDEFNHGAKLFCDEELLAKPAESRV